MEEDNLNCLISPCKRLKLVSPQKLIHMDTETQQGTEKVKPETKQQVNSGETMTDAAEQLTAGKGNEKGLEIENKKVMDDIRPELAAVENSSIDSVESKEVMDDISSEISEVEKCSIDSVANLGPDTDTHDKGGKATEGCDAAQDMNEKNPNDSKAMWSDIYDTVAETVVDIDCDDHIKTGAGEDRPEKEETLLWPGNTTVSGDNGDSEAEESEIIVNCVDNLEYVTEQVMSRDLEMCHSSVSNFKINEIAQTDDIDDTDCVDIEVRNNVERMFCVSGTPTCVGQTDIPTVAKPNEITSSQNEDNVIDNAQTDEVDIKANIQPKTVQFVILETDLDATLTNENSNHYVYTGDKQIHPESYNYKDSGYVAVDEDFSSGDEDEEEVQENKESPKYPLEPAVTILPVSIRKWLHEKGEDDDEPYPVMSSFKPDIGGIQSKSDLDKRDNYGPVGKGSNSIPLCTSTPIIKQNQGLRNRDINIMTVETGQQLKGKILFEDHNIDTKFENGKENTADVKDVETETNIQDKQKKCEKALRRDRESKREKKKLKGTRIQKFKEYVGPGLTSNLGKENETAGEMMKKKDFVKDTDIQTCTLTEYKGFGLTGPLPDKPLKTSTPLPPAGLTVRNPNLGNPGFMTTRGISGTNLAPRPAGTEGMILANFDNPLSGPKVYIDANKPLTNPESSGPHVQFVQKGSCSGQQSSLTDHSSQCPSGTSSALQPDEAYPSVSSNDDRSENNSNTDKSDKSEKLFDPKVLQSNGQLKVSAYMNFGLLTVHVVQARQLSTKWKSACDSFVKMCLIPDDGKKPKCKTDVIQDSNNPLYDEKFSFELTDEDHCKRLMISVWHRDQSASVNEFLGCMSFGIRHLTNPKKEVSGWYYLLTEDIGRKKHLQVSHRQRPQLKVRGNHSSNIPSVNKDVWGTESVQLTVKRGKNGFGFSVIEACPVRVGRVDGSSPAEAAGLQPGDIIVRLNRQNVSRSTATSVAKLIKHSSNTLLLELHRPKPVTLEHEENSFWQIPSAHHQADPYDNPADPYHYDDQCDLTAPQVFTIHENMKENDFPAGDMTICSLNPNIASLATSTPLPLLARGHRTVQTSEVRKQEAIHRLLSLELDFIDLMHCGMQRYSRPLRHCILSHSQHTALFQNIEKLTTISEYHVKQMHDNAPSSFMSEDTDTSVTSDNHSFVLSIGMIYQSKVHMLCQAYDLYAKGISRANQILSELRHNSDFVKFVKEPAGDDSQPSISAFVYRPIQHIRELYRAIQDIFLNTDSDSADYSSLKQVVEGLQECANTITNYSNCCERVESMSSLASRDSKVSFSGSMKSRSSSNSTASSSSRGQGYNGPSCSIQSTKSADLDVMKIQDRLVFSSNVPVFQLCHDDRHLIFSGDMFKWEGHQWMKISLFLFTDMILQTVRENDGYLRVIHEPIMLRDVAAMDAQRHHGTELILYCNNGQSANQKCSLRAPSTEQKYAWKSLVEQRVFAIRGSLEYYSSTSDVSSSSASAIVL